MSMFHCPCCGQPWVGHLTACESPYSISPDGTLTAPNWPAALGEANAECNALRAELEQHRAWWDSRVAELRLWLKRHPHDEQSKKQFWNILANGRPEVSAGADGGLGFSLAQRNERLYAENERLKIERDYLDERLAIQQQRVAELERRRG